LGEPEADLCDGHLCITQQDIQFAGQLGYTIKLLGIVKRGMRPGKPGSYAVQVSVYPALVPNTHVLGSVNGVFNAILVRGDVVGDYALLRSRRGQDCDGKRGVE